MQAQNRFVSFPTRQIALGAILLAAFMLLVLVLFTGVLRTDQPSTAASTQIAVTHQQAPDAQDRNVALSAKSSRWDNQSPDAEERNQQLAK